MAIKYRVKSRLDLARLPHAVDGMPAGFMPKMMSLCGTIIDDYSTICVPNCINALGWLWKFEWLDVIEDTIVEDIDE